MNSEIQTKDNLRRKILGEILKGFFCSTGKCRATAHSLCNVKFNVTSEIPAIFHSGLNYDYNFIL